MIRTPPPVDNAVGIINESGPAWTTFPRDCSESQRYSHEESLAMNDALSRGYLATIAWHLAGCPWKGISGHATN